MSLSRFEAFSDRARAVIGEELAQRMAGLLLLRSGGDRIHPGRLAAELGADEDDIKDAIALATSHDIRLLKAADQVRCPFCETRVDRTPLVESFDRDDEARCSDCEQLIDNPAKLPIEERYALTEEASAEAADWQAAREALPTRTVVIHCALLHELAAIRAQMERFSEATEHVAGNGFIHLGSTFDGQHVRWEIRVAFVEQTNAAAAASLVQAIGDWQPSVAMFVGVAGGIPDEVDLGDVVAATLVYDYEVGKDSGEGYTARELQHRSAFRLKQRAGMSATTPTWRKRIIPAIAELATSREFDVKVEPVAAGSKVVASTTSETYDLIRRAAPRAVAVEMEGAGFLEATHRFPNVDGIVIRGISDLLDGKAGTDKLGWQRQAAANAAAFAFELLDCLST